MFPNDAREGSERFTGQRRESSERFIGHGREGSGIIAGGQDINQAPNDVNGGLTEAKKKKEEWRLISVFSVLMSSGGCGHFLGR